MFFAVCLGISFVTFSLGLAIGRLPVFEIKTWLGLFEGIIEYGTGVSNLPIATLKSTSTLIVFELIIGVYLLSIGNLVLKFLRRKDNCDDLFAAMLSLYGLATLLIFIGRSHRLNILHPSIPFWILIIWTAAKTHKFLYGYLRNKILLNFKVNPYFFQFLIPGLLLLISMTMLFTNPAFQGYPNLLNRFRQGIPVEDFCLFQSPRDICGLSQIEKQSVEELTAVIARMQALNLQGKTLAVFDDRDTLLYMAIDSYPWFRYRPGEVFTKTQLLYIHRQILTQLPDYVLIAANPESKNDVWTQTRLLLDQYYNLQEITGEYEFWSRD